MFAGKRLIESERHFRLPFDVFSPPLTRQPKPEEWKKVTKSRSFYITPSGFGLILTTGRCLRWRGSRILEEGQDEGSVEVCLYY
jgi:hypothetical protein